MDLDKLINDHWEYVKQVLENADLPLSLIELIGFHYKTAFRHGYKHGKEDCNGYSNK